MFVSLSENRPPLGGTQLLQIAGKQIQDGKGMLATPPHTYTPSKKKKKRTQKDKRGRIPEEIEGEFGRENVASFPGPPPEQPASTSLPD